MDLLFVWPFLGHGISRALSLLSGKNNFGSEIGNHALGQMTRYPMFKLRLPVDVVRTH
jgi:hypothetical protein